MAMLPKLDYFKQCKTELYLQFIWPRIKCSGRWSRCWSYSREVTFFVILDECGNKQVIPLNYTDVGTLRLQYLSVGLSLILFWVSQWPCCVSWCFILIHCGCFFIHCVCFLQSLCNIHHSFESYGILGIGHFPDLLQYNNFCASY